MTSELGPRVIQVLDFATSRASELQALHELSQQPIFTSNETIPKLQKQLKQRRRRANAFNSYKMPHRLRQKELFAKTKATQAEGCKKDENGAKMGHSIADSSCR